MGKKIYALIVGINDYPDPKDRLDGAVPDAGKIADYLTNNFPASQLSIKTLLNSDATYQNFITNFRNHLGQAGTDDVIWFHYSGHGSRQATAVEMRPYTSGNMDETIVLVDSRPDGHDLADKELGLLLAEAEKGGAHILVSLDCCHSGSGTRSMESMAPTYKTRLATDRQDGRLLDTYLDGYFVKNGLNFPDPKHILLAACNRFQTAKETFTSSGVFTENLINTLHKSKDDLSYADLFVRLRQGVISNNIPDQDPQIELMGGANGYVRFLDGTPVAGMKKFPVYLEKGDWIMGGGAIQGLQDAAEHNTEVSLFLEDNSEPLTTAVITSVSFQKSVLVPQAQLEPRGKYWGIPKNFPTPPEKMYFEGAPDEITNFMAEMKDFPQMIAAAEAEKDFATFTIKVTIQKLELWENGRQILIATADKTDRTAAQKLLLLANQIVTWKRINRLQNTKTKIEPGSTAIKMEINDTRNASTSYDAGNIMLEDYGGNYPYKIMVQNLIKQPLNFCLLYLSDNYGVTVLKNEPLEALDTPSLFFGGGADDFFFPSPDGNNSNDTFLIIVSTERTDDFELTLEDISIGKSVSGNSETRGVAGINKYVPLTGEWFTSRFNIQIGK